MSIIFKQIDGTLAFKTAIAFIFVIFLQVGINYTLSSKIKRSNVIATKPQLTSDHNVKVVSMCPRYVTYF